MTEMDSPSESDSGRDGVLSYAAEWHALSLGFYDGMKSWKARPKKMRDNPDVKQEPHYYTGGYVLGTLLQLIIAVATGSVAVNLL